MTVVWQHKQESWKAVYKHARAVGMFFQENKICLDVSQDPLLSSSKECVEIGWKKFLIEHEAIISFFFPSASYELVQIVLTK